VAIETRQEFADYCLRNLGGGVINIEISDEQTEDAINLAVKAFNEWHFDGIERDYLSHQITPTKLTVANATGFSVSDKITTSNGANTTVFEVSGNVISTHRNVGTKFAVGQTITNGAVSQVITAVTLGDVDNGYITVDDSIVSVVRLLNLTSVLTNATDTLWNVQYQMMASEMKNLTSSGGAQYFYSMMSYLGHLDFVLKKEKDFRFNRRMNKLFIDVSWTSELYPGTWAAVEVYRALDPENFNEVYDDMWLGKYCTALMKKTWGANLSKYSGLQLPGGVTYDGKYILEQAIAELKDLELEAREMSAPLGFYIG
jgi:hypothetical protein